MKPKSFPEDLSLGMGLGLCLSFSSSCILLCNSPFALLAAVDGHTCKGSGLFLWLSVVSDTPFAWGPSHLLNAELVY